MEQLVTECEETPIVNVASPMQDTVVSSTVTNLLHSLPFSNKNNLHCNADQKMSLNNLTTQHCTCEWLDKFTATISQLAGSTNHELFKCALTVYAKNVTKDAFMWDSKLPKLSMLRNHISNVLLYFHWHQCKEKVDDHFYLQKISDILVIYVNLELKLAKSNKTSMSQLSNELLTVLHIYLDKSEEHIFKIFFKSYLKENKKICFWMFSKYFSDIAKKELKLTSVMFVRYVLALKLWKSLSDNQEELKKINSLGMKIMGSTMPSLCLKNLHFIKQPPKKCINTTMWYKWYLQTKSFDLEAAIESFIQYEENLYNFAISEEPNIIKNNNRCNNHLQLEDILVKKIKKHSKLQKQNTMRKKKKWKINKIIFIDLTEEENLNKNKKRRNLKWLQLLKKRDHLVCSKHRTDSYNSPSNMNKSSINEVIKSYEFGIVNSSDQSCDNSRFNDISILTDSNGIFSNSDVIKNKSNQNIETNKISSICNDFFDDYICNMSIDSCLLNIDSSKDDTIKELAPSLLDFNLSGMDSLSNDFSYSTAEAVDSHLAKKNITDANLSNEELTDLKLCEDDDKNVLSLNEESLITSTNSSMDPFILGLNSDIDEFSKPLFMEKYNSTTTNKEYPISMSDLGYWKKKIIKTSNSREKAKETIIIQKELNGEIFANSDKDEFSKPLLMEKYNLTTSDKEYPISMSDLGYWKKKMIKTNNSREKAKETIIIQKELNGEIFANSEEDNEKRKNRYKRKKETDIDEYDFRFQSEDNDYAVFFNDTKHWKKKILKTNTPVKIKSCDVKEENNLNSKHFQTSVDLKRKQHRRKRLLSTQKMKTSELHSLNDKKRKSEDNKVIIQNESAAESNDKAVLKFLQEKYLPKFIRISSFQILVDYIKSKKNNKIITIFDSDSSIINRVESNEMKPSSSHYFISLLCKKKILLRHYTESKGTLEQQAGILPEKLITLPDSDHDLFYRQFKGNILQADLVIIFTNNLSSISKWLNGKLPKLFIIQEKTRQTKGSSVMKSSPDLKFCINTELEVIQTENYDRGCQLLAENLGWSEELKNYEKTA